jgi:hypothetical protein
MVSQPLSWILDEVALSSGDSIVKEQRTLTYVLVVHEFHGIRRRVLIWSMED